MQENLHALQSTQQDFTRSLLSGIGEYMYLHVQCIYMYLYMYMYTLNGHVLLGGWTETQSRGIYDMQVIVDGIQSSVHNWCVHQESLLKVCVL